MLFFYVGFQIISFLLCPSSASHLYCNNGVDAVLEPTIADLFNASTGGYFDGIASALNGKVPEGKSLGDMHYNVINATYGIATSVGKVRVPFRSLFSDGIFTVPRDHGFSNVFLVQRNFWSVGYLCYFGFDKLGFVKGRNFCGDEDLKDAFSKDDISNSINTSKSFLDHWVVSKPDECSSQSCIIRVDPLRTACIWIQNVESQPTHTGGTGAGEPHTSQRASITYTIETTFLTLTVNQTITQITDGILHENFKPFVNWLIFLIELPVKILPKYVVYGLLGAAIIYSAESLSSDSFFQYAVVALIGAVLFIAWTIYRLYRIAEDEARKSVPMLAPLITLFSGAFVSWMAFSFTVTDVSGLVNGIWNGDSFGSMKWVGKAGIIGAMLLSMLIVRILGLFKRAPETEEVPTIAEKVLFYFVQGVGMLFLCMSSPNLELGLVAVVGGFNYETIEHLIWCMYLQANAVPANRVPTSKVQQIVNSKTEQELAKLRAYMNRHKEEVDDLLQGSVHYDSIRSTIGRFQNGAHNGRAYDDDDGEATGVARGGLIWRLLGYLIVMLAVGALAVYTANKFPF